MLHLFCYGSLKPGERNYRVVEPWVRECRTAWVSGQLYLRETGYPSLELRHPLGLGSYDHEADLALTARNLSLDVPAEVPGCILSLAHGARALHLLDDFEDYLPAGPRPNEYERRLAHAVDESGEVWRVWTYSLAAGQDPGRWQPIPVWPPKS